MARIKLISREEMSEQQKALYDKFPSNLAKGLLTARALAGGYALLGAAFRDTLLSPALRELSILRVAYMSHCEYELMQHKGLAAEQGFTPEDMEAVARDDIGHFDDKTRTVLQFVGECVELVKVSDSTYRETCKYLEEEEIAELVLLVGHYMMTARFLETLEIDLDHAPTSWDNLKF